MRAQDHDPVGDRTVNRGRAGIDLDGAFGAGALEPTKLGHRRGYSFDGGDIINVSAGYSNTSGLVSVLLVWDGVEAGNTMIVFDWEDLAGNIGAQVATTDNGELRFYTGALALNNAARANAVNYCCERLNTLVGVHDGTDTLAYINGVFAAAAVTPLAPVADNDPISVGARVNESAGYVKSIYSVGMADFAMTPSQAKQFHREAVQQFHQV
jgi:hypothetical protein